MDEQLLQSLFLELYPQLEPLTLEEITYLSLFPEDLISSKFSSIKLGRLSNNRKTLYETNRNYFHPIKGAKERHNASMQNETNPTIGLDRTVGRSGRIALSLYGLKGIPSLISGIKAAPLVNGLATGIGIGAGIGVTKTAEGVEKGIDNLLGIETNGIIKNTASLYGIGVGLLIGLPNFRATHFYLNLAPLGYSNAPSIDGKQIVSGGMKAIPNIVKSMLKGLPEDVNKVPEWYKIMQGTGNKVITNGYPKSYIHFRNLAYLKALGIKPKYNLPKKGLSGYEDLKDWEKLLSETTGPEQLYTPNLEYDLNYVNYVRNTLKESPFNPKSYLDYIRFRKALDKPINDQITGNGGFVGAEVHPDGSYTIKDTWDLQPFKPDFTGRELKIPILNKFPKLNKWLQKQDVVPWMGGLKPFTINQTIKP